MSQKPVLTTEDKIDYIYQNLRKQERSKWMKLLVKVLIILALFYGYKMMLDNIKNALTPDLSGIQNSETIQNVTNLLENYLK